MIIYKITNIINGKVYIGKLVNEAAFNSYWGSGLHIGRAVKKYGKDNFKKDILECGIADRKLLCERECYWIKFCDCKSPNGYNLTDGGEGNLNPTLEVREKMKNAKLGKPGTRLGKTGYKHSEETKAKIGAANRGNRYKYTKRLQKFKASRMGSGNPFFGKRHSKEHEEKLRMCHLGKHLSEETKQKIRISLQKRREKQLI
jgi:group I intron endonuclease